MLISYYISSLSCDPFEIYIPNKHINSLIHMIMEQNPLPYLARYPEADVLTSSDQVIPTVVDDSLENWQEGENYTISRI